MMNRKPPLAGVDIARDKLGAAVLREDDTFACATFENSKTGVKQLLRSLKPHGGTAVPVCADATGGCESLLCNMAHEAGHQVLLASSRRVFNFAKSLDLRNKTDRGDARVLARFAQVQEMREWRPKSQARRDLDDLIKLRSHLVKSLDMFRKSSATFTGKAASADAARVIRAQEREVQKVDDKIERLLEGEPEFAESSRLLRSIPGVGPCVSAEFIAAVNIDDFDNPKQLAAYIGVTPARKQSGSSLDRTRISRAGSTRLCRAVYLAAVSGKKHNPLVKACAERIRGNRPELANKQVTLACAHKMVRIIFGVWKNRTEFDPAKAR